MIAMNSKRWRRTSLEEKYMLYAILTRASLYFDSDEFQALGYFLYEAVKIDVHIISFKRSGISICVCKRIGHGLNGGRVGGEHRMKRRGVAFSRSSRGGGNRLLGVMDIICSQNHRWNAGRRGGGSSF